MPNEPEMRLAYYDAVLSVSEKAINAGFDRMLASKGVEKETMEFTIDEEFEKSFKADIGRPQISFLKDTSSLAKMTFAIPKGTYNGGTQLRRGQPEKITKELKDKSLAFNVDVSGIKHDHFTDESFQVEALYLEFTKVRNIHTGNLGLDLGDLGDVPAIVQGVVEKLQKETNDPNKRLFLGGVQVPKVGNTTGPMRPTAAKFRTTTAERNGVSSGELNFLLMMNHRDLPEDATAGIFNGLWTTEKNDAALVLSDYLLLELIALKILKDNYPNASFTLTRGKGDAGSSIKLNKAVEINKGGDNYCTLETCHAFVNDKGQVQIDIRLGRWESCKIGDVDFSLIKVKITKKQSFFIKMQFDKNGDLAPEVEEGKVEELPLEFEGNLGVNSRQDVVKWVAAPLAPAMRVLMHLVTIAAALIKSATTNKMMLDDFRSTFRGAIDAMHMAIMLPGAPVFKFDNPRMVGRQLVVGANYIELPKLRQGECEPFEIGPHPALTALDENPRMQSPRKLIGEVAVPFRMVHDELLDGSQASKMPYYVLRREQYWDCVFNHRFTGIPESKEVKFERRKTETSNTRETKGFNFGVETEANLSAYEQSFKTTLKYEQRFEQVFETTRGTETTNTVTQQVTIPEGQPFAVAVYLLVDRYVLSRNDPTRSQVASWEDRLERFRHDVIFPADRRWPDKSSSGGSPAGAPNIGAVDNILGNT